MGIKTCREIGRDLRERGCHATEPGNLAKWLNAYSTWPDQIVEEGYNAAIAAVFKGWRERDAELFEEEHPMAAWTDEDGKAQE